MTDPTMALMEILSKFGLQIDSDILREGLRTLVQAVIEAEVTQRIGAGPAACHAERAQSRARHPA